MALRKYISATECAEYEAITLPPPILESLSRPSLLLMVIGSRGDIQVFLNIAKRLILQHGYRIRLATHPVHRSLVEKEGIEFYSVGGDPEEFAKAFTENPNILLSTINGELQAMRRLFTSMVGRYWNSSIDNFADIAGAEKSQKVMQRPFLADTIISSLPVLAHIHCAEKLQVPLLLVSVQPILPTSDFPHPFTLTKPKFIPGRRWNLLSYKLIEILYVLRF